MTSSNGCILVVLALADSTIHNHTWKGRISYESELFDSYVCMLRNIREQR